MGDAENHAPQYVRKAEYTAFAMVVPFWALVAMGIALLRGYFAYLVHVFHGKVAWSFEVGLFDRELLAKYYKNADQATRHYTQAIEILLAVIMLVAFLLLMILLRRFLIRRRLSNIAS